MAVRIIPRWEWRTFSAKPFEFLDPIFEKMNRLKTKESRETHIVSQRGGAVAKIREDGLLDVKLLVDRSLSGIERWSPVLRSAFPLSSDTMESLFDFLDLPFAFADDISECRNTDELLNVLVPQTRGLASVEVTRKLEVCSFEGTTLETGVVTFPNEVRHTLCIECEDLSKVDFVIRSTRLKKLPLINYLRELRKQTEFVK